MDAYRCPSAEQLPYRYTTVEQGMTLKRHWTTARGRCAIKARHAPTPEHCVTRLEHEGCPSHVMPTRREPRGDAGATANRRTCVRDD